MNDDSAETELLYESEKVPAEKVCWGDAEGSETVFSAVGLAVEDDAGVSVQDLESSTEFVLVPRECVRLRVGVPILLVTDGPDCERDGVCSGVPVVVISVDALSVRGLGDGSTLSDTVPDLEGVGVGGGVRVGVGVFVLECDTESVSESDPTSENEGDSVLVNWGVLDVDALGIEEKECEGVFVRVRLPVGVAEGSRDIVADCVFEADGSAVAVPGVWVRLQLMVPSDDGVGDDVCDGDPMVLETVRERDVDTDESWDTVCVSVMVTVSDLEGCC